MEVIQARRCRRVDAFPDESSYVRTRRVRLVAIYGHRKGVKEREVFILRSADDGKSWRHPVAPEGPKGWT